MADTVNKISIRQQDGTYVSKDIEVDYSNVVGLSTHATAYRALTADSATTANTATNATNATKATSATSATKATKDKNNKDITTYIASGSHNGNNLVLTNGAGTSSNVDLSMVGATASANGTAGFVPQPTSANKDKFLKADGTWDMPPGKEYTGSSNISISNSNVIDLKNTEVTAGTYGPADNVIGNNGSTLSVPNITVDAKGRITNISNKTYTSVDTKNASSLNYSNISSGLISNNVQDAIDEIKSNFQDGVDAVYDAVVAKGSTPSSHSLSDVVQGINDIETGIVPTGSINITTNGTKDITEYASVNVQVPASEVVSGTLDITTNGIKDVTEYASANVQVPASAVVSGNKSITNNGSNIDVTTYKTVSVAVPASAVVSGNKPITANGSNIDVTSYKTVSVSVPNSNSGTYTYGSGSTGDTVDMGATNSYRYVNASNVYAKGKADGRSFSSQTKTFTVNSPQGGRWETLTAQCTFPTKIVGITSYDNGSSPWHCVMSIGFSGNTITAVVDGYESSSPWTFNVTAIGY